ncbi:MAG TPA: hypothetical protein VFX50_15395 [Gemmatimonadales bacterium]|nr:hypothetical protein [Gemmatimonadales bacterium]
MASAPDPATTAALWGAVAGLGAFHGLNPAMGWPLAVANGLAARRAGALFATALPLGAGHFLAMAVVLVPFTVLSLYAEWQRPIRLAAGLLVLGYGLWRCVSTRHPRFLARVPPTRLALWSFLVATAHGAGLMLLPVALGLCAAAPRTALPAAEGLAGALAVSGLHTAAMLAAGLVAAWVVYRYVGLGLLTRGWLDLDRAWGASLALAGAASLALAWGA